MPDLITGAKISTNDSGAYVYVIWNNISPSNSVTAGISNDFGSTFDTIALLAGINGDYSQITTDTTGQYAYAIWQDNSGDTKISVSSDYGSNFSVILE